jgi:hypothetical protein
MAVPVDNVFFPQSIAVRATCVRKRLTFRKASETGFVPYKSAIMDTSIRTWTIQAIPAHVVRDEGLATDVEKVWHMWEAAKAGLYNFKFQPPFNYTVRSGQGSIVSGVYYQVYTTRDPSNTIVRQELRSVIPNSGAIVVGATWTGTFHVAAEFISDELDEEAEGEDMTLTLPTIQISEVLLA